MCIIYMGSWLRQGAGAHSGPQQHVDPGARNKGFHPLCSCHVLVIMYSSYSWLRRGAGAHPGPKQNVGPGAQVAPAGRLLGVQRLENRLQRLRGLARHPLAVQRLLQLLQTKGTPPSQLDMHRGLW